MWAETRRRFRLRGWRPVLERGPRTTYRDGSLTRHCGGSTAGSKTSTECGYERGQRGDNVTFYPLHSISSENALALAATSAGSIPVSRGASFGSTPLLRRNEAIISLLIPEFIKYHSNEGIRQKELEEALRETETKQFILE